MANIELDGGNKKITVDSGDLTLDIPGDIILDADGGDVTFADGGTNLLKITNSSSDVVFQPQVDTKDIVFKQYDGTVVATVEDNATFNVPTGKLAINGTAITATAAEINLIDGGTARGTTAIADGDGVLINDAGTMRQTTVETLKTYIGSAKLVQYVIGTNSSEGTNGTSTDAATGLTLDITPTDANNKMVIFAQDVYKTENDGSTDASGRAGFFTLYKDSSKLNDTKAIVGGNLAASSTAALPCFFGTVTLMGTETAGSTSQRTYKLMCDTNGAAVVTFNEEGFDSFIIAIELAV